MLKKLELVVGSGFGSGLLPLAPGTWGSFFAAIIGMGFILWLGNWFITVLLILSLAAGFWSAPAYIRAFGEDPKSFVMDEWSGQFLSMHIVFILPLELEVPILSGVIFASFLLFRLFDILKPFGIKKIEMIMGPAGIILDDLAAGFYTLLLLFIVILALL
jgi:phosphatidylglycerophosphatase A